MKKTTLVFLFLTFITRSFAQTVPKSDSLNFPDYPAPWCFDINLRGGILTQNISAISLTSGYNPLTSNATTPAFKKGGAYGVDAQIGYFFDKKGHFGVGLGLLVQIQTSKLDLSQFNVAYQSWDDSNHTFRQLLTADHAIQETILTTNINIPLVFKYKTKLWERFGLTADAGLLYNLTLQNRYNTNANFDYEAIYKYSVADGQWVYDPTLPYAEGDILYTKAGVKSANQVAYFSSLHTQQGFNVGLNQKPDQTTGHTTFKAGTLGLILQPSLSWYINDNTTLNFGPYMTWQSTQNATPANYRITDQVGQYSSLLNTASTYTAIVFGLNAGIRYTFGKPKDRDHDGIPDRDDQCPDEFGVARFNGCPDSDMDGIPDREDSCPHQHGLVQFNGCPDTDGDGIPDKIDSCPTQAGLAIFNGCPDMDGDGIPDRADSCPRQPGLAQFNGCPDSDGDGIPDNLDACPFLAGNAANHGCPDSASEAAAHAGTAASGGPTMANGRPAPAVRNRNIHTSVVTELDRKQIHFDFNKATLNKASFKYLQTIAKTMKDNPGTVLTIDGFSDGVGPAKANINMSEKRAESVKKYMMKQGIPADRLKARGHGKRQPIASNKTRSGRAKNRRALMVVKSTAHNLLEHTVAANSSAINVYPNEEKGSFTIVLKTNFEEKADVTITNAKGKVVKQFAIDANKPVEFTLDAPGGMYSFTASTKTTRYEAKIIISE